MHVCFLTHSISFKLRCMCGITASKGCHWTSHDPQSKTLNNSERYTVKQLVGPPICAACCPFEMVQETAFKNHTRILEEFATGVFTCPNATCTHLYIYDAEGILYCHTFELFRYAMD